MWTRTLLSMFCLAVLWTSGYSTADDFTVEFELQSGFVVINAEVDGVPGTYILDSGAPGLVLNEGRHNYTSDISVGVQGTGGASNAHLIQISKFSWNLFSIQDLEAFAIDLTYLEARLGRPVSGLVGISLFAGYGILVDYDARTVSLHARGTPVPISETHIQLPLVMEGHLPMITIQSGDRQLRLGIDTGARSNIIAANACDFIPASLKNITRYIDLVGVDQNAVRTCEVRISGLTANGLTLTPTNFVVANMSHLNTDGQNTLDGILGHPFFDRRKVYIDAERSYIYLTASAQDEITRVLMASL